MGDPIDDLIEEIIVDAYGEHEQLWSFRQAFEDEARLPFRGQVIGVDVKVTSVGFDGDQRRGLVAVCKRAGEVHKVSLLEVAPVGPLPLRTRQLFDAYRRWAGADLLIPVTPEHATRWVYPRFASVTIDAAPALALQPMGDWDPSEEYWGEPGYPLDAISEEVIAAGVRPCFEMEQVLPGVEPDDWDTDPIVKAAELHRAGYHRESIRLLEGLLAIDARCIDAWGHLGLVAFDTRGPGAAAKLYETGVAVAERSWPDGFAGVMPWGMVDNRPFLRCLHGLALCAWRQRRWDDAEAMFTARVWLDPSGADRRPRLPGPGPRPDAVDSVMTGTPRRPPIYGPEPWTTTASVEWCHFDQWFAIVGAYDFGGDLDALEAELVRRLRSSRHGRRDVEAKLSHLADLRDRLARSGIDATALSAADEPDKATVAKARRKVLDQELEGRAMTPAMRDTPSARLQRRALYGHWDRFPVNPDLWYEKLAGRRPATYVPKGRTFALTRQLGERLRRLDGPRRAEADRLALYRAFHTVGVELAERGDDSYGNIGELRVDAFCTYLGIDWAAAGMEPEHWWQDMCELLVAEVYALTYQRETMAFERVCAGQTDLVEGILLDLAGEWRAAYQDYQADEALQLVAWLHIAGRRHSRYASAAHRLGSDHWMPIVALAKSAVADGRNELAIEVFRAADQPGLHRDHLRDRCLKLTGIRLEDPAPPLRVVK